MPRAALQPVAIPAAAATPAPAVNREHEVAQQTRRKLLLQYAVRINHQVSLLPHAGQPDDNRETDDKGRPINRLQEITAAVKMLSVELRHEYPLQLADPLAPPSETPLNLADDPLAGLIVKFPEPPPASKSSRSRQSSGKRKA